jgi:hypothetical protein
MSDAAHSHMQQFCECHRHVHWLTVGVAVLCRCGHPDYEHLDGRGTCLGELWRSPHGAPWQPAPRHVVTLESLLLAGISRPMAETLRSLCDLPERALDGLESEPE